MFANLKLNLKAFSIKLWRFVCRLVFKIRLLKLKSALANTDTAPVYLLRMSPAVLADGWGGVMMEDGAREVVNHQHLPFKRIFDKQRYTVQPQVLLGYKHNTRVNNTQLLTITH